MGACGGVTRERIRGPVTDWTVKTREIKLHQGTEFVAKEHPQEMKLEGQVKARMVEDVHGHVRKIEMHPEGSGHHWSPCSWPVM